MHKKTKSDYVDLRSPSDLPMFNKVLKTFEKKGVFILVHADFCGPCQRYKASVWDHLVNNKNRKAGIAGIHYDQLENSPFSNAKINGYPSVLYVTQNGTVKKVSNFKEDSGITNAMPQDTMQNKELMETLINSEPKEVQKLVPSMEVTEDNTVESSSDEEEEVPTNSVVENESSDGLSKIKEPPFSDKTSKLRNLISGNVAMRNITNIPVPSNKGTPPKEVLLDSQEKNEILDFDPNGKSRKENAVTKETTDNNPVNTDVANIDEPTTGKGVAVGGTLYKSLVKLARRKTNKKKSRKMKHKLTAKKQKLR